MVTEHHRFSKWQWLLSSGKKWLDQLQGTVDLVSEERLLRRSIGAWQAAMLVEQVQLQRRASPRFPNAAQWWWTDRGLQQSSDWHCAAFKASLIPEHARVMDVCCGVGADLVAIAGRCDVVGLDRDPILVMLAAANLKNHDRAGRLVVGEFPSAIGSVRHAWMHIDPDRRPSGQRVTRGDEFSPTLADCMTYAPQAEGSIIKLAPATAVSQSVAAEFRRGWIGSAGECRQQLLVRGNCAVNLASKFAVLCDPASSPTMFQQEAERPPIPVIANRVEDYVYDLHPVLHAATLQVDWAQQNSLAALSSATGYFTSSSVLESVWATRFRVLDVVAWDQRKVRSWLRIRSAGIVEVKKRLVELDANAYQRQLSRQEGEPITLLVTRFADRTIAIAAKREK